MQIAVITPLFDEPVSFLERNLKSVHSQYFEGKIVQYVILDGIAEEYKLKDYIKITDSYKAKLLIHEQNKGLPSARNTGLKKAYTDGADFFMLLDTDDVFVVNRVKDQIDFMLKNSVDHCYGGYRELYSTFYKPQEHAKPIIPPDNALEQLIKGNNPCYCGSNCFTRKVYEKIKNFDEKMTFGCEDMEYWIRIGLAGFKQVCLPKVLYYLGIHANNMTARYLKNGNFKKAYQYIQTKHNIIF